MTGERSAGQAPSLTITDGVARIVLRRPALHNRLEVEDIVALADFVVRIGGDPTIRVVVVTGEGDKTFSSGYNVGAIVGTLDTRFEKLIDAIEAIAVPTVCALNGSVYGGATDLALACDFRIGVTGSRMFMPAARFGLCYYPGGLRRYYTRLGLTQAKKLFLTALPIEAIEMRRIGYLTELVEPDALEATVRSYTDALLENEAGALRSMKAHLNSLADGRFEEQLSARDYLDSVASDTLRERLAARDK